MAGEVVAWHMKPTPQGGGGQQTSTFANLTIERLGYTQNGGSQSGSWGFRTGTVGNGIQRWLTIGESGPTLPARYRAVANGRSRQGGAHLPVIPSLSAKNGKG